MPLDKKLREHIKEWASIEVLNNLSFSSATSAHQMIKILDEMVSYLGCLIEKERDKCKLNLDGLDYKPLKDKINSFLEYVEDPTLLGVLPEDNGEFYQLLQEAILIKIQQLKKLFSKENIEAFQMKEVLDHWYQIKSILKDQYAYQRKMEDKLQGYAKTMKDRKDKEIVQLFLNQLSDALLLIPKVKWKPVPLQITLMVLTLENELLKQTLREPEIPAIILECLLRNTMKEITKPWFIEKQNRLTSDPSKSLSIYPDPWLDILKRSLNMLDADEATRFETLLDFINEELDEEEESVTLNILKDEKVREGLLNKQISILELVNSPKFLILELHKIFHENAPPPPKAGAVLLPLIRARCFGFAELLIKLKANPNHPDGMTNQTPLHLLCTMQGTLPLIQVLLKNEALVNVQDYNNNTPLHVLILRALEHPKEEVEKIMGCLIEHGGGSDLNLQDNEGNTPLHLALKGYLSGPQYSIYKEIAKLLLTLGGDYSLKDKESKTIFDIAKAIEDKELTELVTRIEIDFNKEQTEKKKMEEERLKEDKKKEAEKKKKDEEKKKDKESSKAKASVFAKALTDLLADTKEKEKKQDVEIGGASGLFDAIPEETDSDIIPEVVTFHPSDSRSSGSHSFGSQFLGSHPLGSHPLGRSVNFHQRRAAIPLVPLFHSRSESKEKEEKEHEETKEEREKREKEEEELAINLSRALAEGLANSARTQSSDGENIDVIIDIRDPTVRPTNPEPPEPPDPPVPQRPLPKPPGGPS